MISKLTVAIAFVGLCGCATAPSSNVDLVREGMDKAQVLDKAGNPKRTFRTSGQDHWIYVFFKGDQEYSRIVSFDEGKVSKVGPASKKTNWAREMESLEKR